MFYAIKIFLCVILILIDFFFYRQKHDIILINTEKFLNKYIMQRGENMDIDYTSIIKKRLKKAFSKSNDLIGRISAIFIITSIFLSIIAIIVEIALKQPLWMIFPSVVILIFCVLTPIVSDDIKRPIIVMIFLVTYIYIPFLYFSNGGNDGAILLLFIMIIVYEGYYLESKILVVNLSATIIFYSLLIIYGYKYPQHTIGYISAFDKFIADIVVFNAVSIVISIISVATFKGYRDEHKKLNQLKKELESQNKKLIELSIIDQLTGIHNRRHFDEILYSELEHFKTHKKNFNLLMIDIDDFKIINDKYGHLFGDEVLRKVANQIKISTRDYDFIARYGGEEFGVILSHSNSNEWGVIAERIRRNVESINLRYDIKVTVSIGAACNQENDSIEEIIERSDKMLYKAKNEGKNIVIHSV